MCTCQVWGGEEEDKPSCKKRMEKLGMNTPEVRKLKVGIWRIFGGYGKGMTAACHV